MKNIFTLLAILLSLFAVACSGPAQMTPEVPETPTYVDTNSESPCMDSLKARAGAAYEDLGDKVEEAYEAGKKKLKEKKDEAVEAAGEKLDELKDRAGKAYDAFMED